MSASGILSSNVSQKFSSIPLAVRLGSVVVRMKTINEVLLQKELELVRVGKELDALRIAAPLLRGDEADVDSSLPSFHGGSVGGTKQQPAFSRSHRSGNTSKKVHGSRWLQGC